MDTSSQTPSPDAHLSAATGQLILSAENEQFIEDLFGASSTGNRTLPDPRTSSSIGLTPASDFSGARAPLSPADPDRLWADYLVRLSTLAVSVAIDGLDNQDFSIHEFQRAAVHTFKDLFPTTQDTALLPLLQIFFFAMLPLLQVLVLSCRLQSLLSMNPDLPTFLSPRPVPLRPRNPRTTLRVSLPSKQSIPCFLLPTRTPFARLSSPGPTTRGRVFYPY